jgi:hypothetical protein
MIWGFILLSIGIVAAAGAAGLLVGYIVLRIQHRPWPFSRRAAARNGANENENRTTSGVQDGHRGQNTIVSPVLAELERNMEIAAAPAGQELRQFQTDVWNTRHHEFEVLDLKVLSDLTQAYVDINSANNVVWMSKEFGAGSQNTIEDYTRIRAKVAERLQRVLPDVRKQFEHG